MDKSLLFIKFTPLYTKKIKFLRYKILLSLAKLRAYGGNRIFACGGGIHQKYIPSKFKNINLILNYIK